MALVQQNASDPAARGVAALRELALPAYRRPDGRFGIRNHVLVLPVDDVSNRACELVAAAVPGVLAIPHAYGRLQFGADLELTFRTLIGTGLNPNVAAVVVIGIEPGWTNRLVTGIAASGKPVQGYSIEGAGDLRTAMTAASCARDYLQYASELQRTECQVSDLWISAKCGESDTTTGCASNPTVGRVFDRLEEAGATLLFGETSELTGAEHLVAERCANADVARQFLSAFEAYNAEILRHKTNDLSESNPTRGNIAGGITTIEEKALGAMTKIGRARIVGVVGTAERPRGPGLWFMDSSGAGAEMLTACAAAGAVAHLFTTGQGNVVGNPILPVIKITAHPTTAHVMADHIDVDVSGLLQREITLDEAADRVLAMLLRTCRGRLTAAEALGHNDFALTRLFRTA
jgi:(2R)-sulfolactate sulfo-lyase subunit beta